jgi:hypothetical protein
LGLVNWVLLIEVGMWIDETEEVLKPSIAACFTDQARE